MITVLTLIGLTASLLTLCELVLVVLIPIAVFAKMNDNERLYLIAIWCFSIWNLIITWLLLGR